MKIRNDFVTNSSSSSFLIAKKHLDEDQLEAIRNHTEMMEALGLMDTACPELMFPWTIEENADFITGYVFMDNLSISDLFTAIGIPENVVDWDEFEFDLDDTSDAYEETDDEDWRNILHNITDNTQ